MPLQSLWLIWKSTDTIDSFVTIYAITIYLKLDPCHFVHLDYDLNCFFVTVFSCGSKCPLPPILWDSHICAWHGAAACGSEGEASVMCEHDRRDNPTCGWWKIWCKKDDRGVFTVLARLSISRGMYNQSHPLSAITNWGYSLKNVLIP